MNSTMTQMTAQTPSCFAMPISVPMSGSAYAAARGAAQVTLAGTVAGPVQGITAAVALTVRDRHVAGTSVSTVSTVKGDFPGTSAWRPPIC